MILKIQMHDNKLIKYFTVNFNLLETLWMNSQDVLVRILTPSTSASKQQGPFIGYMLYSEGNHKTTIDVSVDVYKPCA